METAAADGAGGASGSPNGGSSGDGAGAAGLMTNSLQKETGTLSGGDGEITGPNASQCPLHRLPHDLVGPEGLVQSIARGREGCQVPFDHATQGY